jgi:hypothetical protein
MTTINNLVNYNPNSNIANQAKTASEKTQQKTTTLAADNVDKFDTSSVNVNRNYQHGATRTENPNIQVQGYRRMSDVQMKNAVVADFVKHAMSNQANNKSLDFWNSILNEKFTPRPFALEAFKAAEATSEKHEDYWGVEAVAERIFTFAKSLAGNRDDLFDTMKNAFLKGFSQASSAARGKLPEISHQTKQRVLELFDGWEKEINERKNPTEK